ncbi:MAG TPA: SDR family NAD(P)-dependent oxidoreductase [Solirubrobacteraceae bacterium]|nr:SDR family NAD(P)-dependent oxidoreductase [Solirubrobacteraceae bacterium]
MRRDLSQCVVVITGASSGFGRAAARQFAERGSRVVLAARSERPLQAVASECEACGAEALVVATDVRDEQRVQMLADAALQRFGRVDVWLNNAGVIAYGRFAEVPSEVFRNVIETNLMGQVHGARAALRAFGHGDAGGVLINMASVWGRVSAPDVSAYVASKFAIRAFGECLRQELRGVPGIDVVAVLPQAGDTPIFAQAANFSGRGVRPIPPLVDPEGVARGIVRCAECPKPEVTFGRAGRLFEMLHLLAPRLYSRVLPPAFELGNYRRDAVSETAGRVLAPTDEQAAYEVRGGWKRDRRTELARALAATLTGLLKGLFGRG